MPERKRPMFTMSTAAEAAGRPLTKVPLDLGIEDVRGQSYLALRAGGVAVYLTECEARALAAAMKTLSILASAPDSARDHIERSRTGEERV
jgi:hypothetical protein